jgi:hypothetical protein
MAPITGKFAADFDDFYDAVSKADAQLKDLMAGAGGVEKSLNRMVDSFSGRKVIADATMMAEAIERLGGASKLTSAELQKASATAAEAAAKMRAMGVDVPERIEKLAKASDGLNTSMKGTGETVRANTSAFSQFNDILGAVGIHLGPAPKAMDELAGASGKTALQLGTLTTAGLALGAAMGGWKIGRAIAEFTGSDKIIGDAVASLMGWTTAAGGAGSAADTLARASAAAGREIVSLDEALKINIETVKNAQAGWARMRAPEEAAKLVKQYHDELAKLAKAGVLDDLKRQLEANIVPQGELARLYGLSAGALRILTTEQATHKERIDRINSANEKQVALQNQLFGRELTAKAQEYVRAIGGLENVTKMLPDQMAQVHATAVAAATHLERMGQAASAGAEQIRALAIATTDWDAINKKVAATPDPVSAILRKRSEAWRDSQMQQMNENQGLTDNAQYWAHAGEIADAAMAQAGEAAKQTTAVVEEQTQSVDALAASFTLLNMSADQWRAKAAGLEADAERNMQSGAGGTFWSASSIALDQRAQAQRDRDRAARQAALDTSIASINAPWGGGGASYSINVNAMQGINGDQVAEELIAGMRRRGVSLG